MIKYKNKADAILTTGDIRRIQAEIVADTKTREEASERIARNQALLEAHDRAVTSRLSPSSTLRNIRIRRVEEKPVSRINTFRPTSPAPVAHEVEAKVALPTKLPRGGGSVGIVRNVLRDHPEGLAAPELKRRAGEHPEASKSLREHGQYIYSILETLEERGEAVKGEDGKWRPTKQQIAATAATH